MKFYIDSIGSYLGGWDNNPPQGSVEVPCPPSDARQIWDAVSQYWLPVQLTEQEMRESEIAQDKQYLADTDYIVAKLSEATALGLDTSSLVEQYATQLEQREQARLRIRINEGRA